MEKFYFILSYDYMRYFD